MDLFNDEYFLEREKVFDFNVFTPPNNYLDESFTSKQLKISKTETFFPSFGMQYTNEEENSHSETSDLGV